MPAKNTMAPEKLTGLEPAGSAFAITKDDNNDLAYVTRGIYVGTSGDLKVDMADGSTVTFASLAAGVVHPLRVRKVYSSVTSALNIVGVY
jgi:hypothetical protein